MLSIVSRSRWFFNMSYVYTENSCPMLHKNPLRLVWSQLKGEKQDKMRLNILSEETFVEEKKSHEIVYHFVTVLYTWNSLPFSSNWLVLSWNVASKDHFWCQYHHGAFLQSIEAISLHQLLIHRMTQHNWKSQFVLPILWRLHCFWQEK